VVCKIALDNCQRLRGGKEYWSWIKLEYFMHFRDEYPVMIQNKKFDLTIHSKEICKKARINPNAHLSILRENGDYSSIKYYKFVEILLIQNWRPLLDDNWNFDPDYFIHALKDSDWEAGRPPETDILIYLKLLKKYQLFGPEIISIPDANSIFLKLHRNVGQPVHWFLFGEEGSLQNHLISTIPYSYVRASFSSIGDQPTKLPQTDEIVMLATSLMPGDSLSDSFIFNCDADTSEMLHSLIFGHAKDSFPEAYHDVKGAVEVLDDLLKRESPRYEEEGLEINRVLALVDFQKANIVLQRATIDFINRGVYCRLGETKERSSSCTVAIAISRPSEMHNIETIGIRPDLQCISEFVSHKFRPLRETRYEIPFRLFKLTLGFLQRYQSTAELVFPHILIEYWFWLEQWPKNQDQLYEEFTQYALKFKQLSRESQLNYIKKPDSYRKRHRSKWGSNSVKTALEHNKETYLKLIELPLSLAFQEYVKTANLEPYDILDIFEIISKPFYYYAIRYFNTKSMKWDINDESITNAMRNFPATGQRIIQSHANNQKKQNPANGIKQYSFKDFKSLNCFVKKRPDGERATGEIELNNDEGRSIHVRFNRVNTKQFTMFLFLIMEREAGGHDWLSSIDPPKLSPQKAEFEKLQKYCTIYDVTKNICTWTSIDGMRASTVKDINKIFKEAGFSEKIITLLKFLPDGSKLKNYASYQLTVESAKIKYID
jgi:hypothetical protein